MPQRIEKGASGVTKSRSSVCRSRSLLIAPAVSAGVMKPRSATWNTIKNMKRYMP